MLKTMIGFEFDYHLEFASYRKKVVVLIWCKMFKKGCVQKSLVDVKFPLQGVSVTKCSDKHL